MYHKSQFPFITAWCRSYSCKTMYRKASFLLAFLLFGSIATSNYNVALAQVSVAGNRNNSELKQLLEEGRALVDARDYETAQDVYRRALVIQPKNASIHSGIGLMYLKQGNLRAALPAFRQAVKLNPNNGDFQFALGFVSQSLGDNATARQAYRRAIQINRRHFDAHLGLAQVMLRLGDKKSAIWAYEQAVKIDPKNPQAMEFKGTLLMQQGQSQQAISHFQQARSLYESQGKMESVTRVEGMLKQLGV